METGEENENTYFFYSLVDLFLPQQEKLKDVVNYEHSWNKDSFFFNKIRNTRCSQGMKYEQKREMRIKNTVKTVVFFFSLHEYIRFERNTTGMV